VIFWESDLIRIDTRVVIFEGMKCVILNHGGVQVYAVLYVVIKL
jgi:hypothetical protein